MTDMTLISARIERIDGNTVWVQIEAPASCGACAGRGCGSSVYARIWHQTPPSYRLENRIGAQVGDAVVIGLPAGALWRAALWAYALPLLLAVLGAGLLTRWGDAAALAGALIGLLLGALAMRFLGGRGVGQSPVLLRFGGMQCKGNTS